MAKPDLYRCTECGWSGVKWLGQCPECQAWGSVDEVGGVTKASLQPGRIITPAKPIAEIDVASAIARSSGVPELDRVLGGGIVPGAAILLAGEPGVAKSPPPRSASEPNDLKHFTPTSFSQLKAISEFCSPTLIK